jgi:hypothetical protein
MIPIPPNPFQPEQPNQNPLDNVRHLRVYEEAGKLRVQPIPDLTGLPGGAHGFPLVQARDGSIFFIHVDIDTDEERKLTIAERVATLYINYHRGDVPAEDS